MGKFGNISCDSDQSQERIQRRKKRKKDQLEEIRRNALAAKRTLKTRPAVSQKPKTSFVKTLHQFAARKRELESQGQSQNLLLNQSKINHENILPERLKITGFFRGGIKGKLVTRPLEAQDKIKNAILNNDALQLMQSGGLSKSETFKNPSNGDMNLEMKREMGKLFRNSSESSSTVTDLLFTDQETKSSPVLGRIKKSNKNNVVKSDTTKIMENVALQRSPSPEKKDEKYKRKLFEDENSNKKNRNIQYLNNNRDNTSLSELSSTKLTPENIIFFTEYVPQKHKDDKPNKKHINNKNNPTNSPLIKYYIQKYKIFVEEHLKNIPWTDVTDPLEATKTALKTTYANAFKEDLRRQKADDQNSCSLNKTIAFNNSEIMLEPDSAIRRILKKNTNPQTKCVIQNRLISETNSDLSSNEFDDSEPFTLIDSTKNNYIKRKHVPSRSKYSEKEIFSSTKANANAETEKIVLKFESVNEERQELVARYLNDIYTNKTHLRKKGDNSENMIKEINVHSKNERLFTNDDITDTYLIQRSKKHIPAILRKNRSLVDCIAKKKILLSIEKCSKSNKMNNNFTELDFSVDNSLESERTPNCGTVVNNHVLEAPKSKYAYMNAKYNQPLRINAPLIQGKKLQRNENTISAKHLFLSPKNIERNVDRNFVVSQQYQLSPIKPEIDFLTNKQNIYEYQLSQENTELNNHNFHKCQSLQGNSQQENNCMVKMVSFGDIQERTNRLTLRSSQNQNCSQNSIKEICSSQEKPHDSHNNLCHLQCEPSQNCMTYNDQLRRAYNEIPTPQNFNIALNARCNCHSHGITESEERHYVYKNDFQLMPSNNYPFQESGNNYQISDCQTCRKRSYRHHQEALINHIPLEHQQSQNPVKFLAVSENNITQRRPIYSMNENNYVHKTSIAKQQCAPIMKTVHSKNASYQSCYSIPTLQYCKQEVAKSITNPEYNYSNIHEVNNTISSNVQRPVNYESKVLELNRNSNSYVSNNMPNQVYVTQHMPLHPGAANQKYIEQYRHKQNQAALYSQAEYQRNFYDNNEAHSTNGIYVPQMNHVLYSKKL